MICWNDTWRSRDLLAVFVRHPALLQPLPHLLHVVCRLLLQPQLRQERAPSVHLQLPHCVQRCDAEELVEGDGRVDRPQGLVYGLARLSERRPVVDQLARVLPEDVNAEDDAVGLGEEELEEPELDPLHTSSDRLRVLGKPLPELFRLPTVLDRLVPGASDERHLGDGPDADGVEQGVGHEALGVSSSRPRHPGRLGRGLEAEHDRPVLVHVHPEGLKAHCPGVGASPGRGHQDLSADICQRLALLGGRLPQLDAHRPADVGVARSFLLQHLLHLRVEDDPHLIQAQVLLQLQRRIAIDSDPEEGDVEALGANEHGDLAVEARENLGELDGDDSCSHDGDRLRKEGQAADGVGVEDPLLVVGDSRHAVGGRACGDQDPLALHGDAPVGLSEGHLHLRAAQQLRRPAEVRDSAGLHCRQIALPRGLDNVRGQLLHLLPHCHVLEPHLLQRPDIDLLGSVSQRLGEQAGRP
eukprot:455746-Hanusia_phi.AAC.2